ncbi:MAG: biopolymer transporter ExbD [Myxococcota bacterium]|nr:biopolymer transporter ExbD [Myxococcota bacterium]
MRRLAATRRAGPSPVGHAGLTSLVDVVTILLVFLLRSYSVDPPVRPDDPGFQLPLSAAETPVVRALEVDVTGELIAVEGRRTADTGYYASRDEDLVEELYVAVQASAARAVNVRVDRDVPYGITRKVLFTCQQAGADQLTLVARSRAGL